MKPSILSLMRRVHRGDLTPEAALEIFRAAEGPERGKTPPSNTQGGGDEA